MCDPTIFAYFEETEKGTKGIGSHRGGSPRWFSNAVQPYSEIDMPRHNLVEEVRLHVNKYPSTRQPP